MKKDKIIVKGLEIDVYSFNTMVVGSGAAGFNAADSLYSMGQKDVAIITEGINMGTSRNTGSDKQTYYKLTLAGGAPDSVLDMAKTLFDGGSRHGDIALVEAALSARCFYKLAEIGVPFPHNRVGEYIGYKTDHDPRQRATSAGPLTSKFMTEKLEAQVKLKGIDIFDGYLVIGILTEEQACDSCAAEDSKAIGLIALNLNDLESRSRGITLFNCTNIVFAVGGPAGMYLTSVYPESQTGSSGIAFEAGAKGINLTESQFGIASIKFRWNLSGTYQQVIPRYVSTNQDGSDEREFLDEYFNTAGSMMDAIFLKGYQWPFDPRKIKSYGSSLIDILVHNETQIKGRRVFLDFMRNPAWGSKNGELDFSLLGGEAYEYLENSNAIFGTPIQRLLKMNKPAVDLYKNNGIDVTKEYLEIAVCAQHNNGGLAGNLWWESNVKHLFPVGEVNGTFGVYRPGGSALNSTQAGSLRAAQYISSNYSEKPSSTDVFTEKTRLQIENKIDMITAMTAKLASKSNLDEITHRIRLRMTKAGAHIRNAADVAQKLKECSEDMHLLHHGLLELSSTKDLPQAFRIRDMLITQFVYLNAIAEYIRNEGGSRGSYIISNPKGELPVEGMPEDFRHIPENEKLRDYICEVSLNIKKEDYTCSYKWEPVRPLNAEDDWFENVWNAYLKGDIIK